jgi:quercetin dioxygenase-like cupin family protein
MREERYALQVSGTRLPQAANVDVAVSDDRKSSFLNWRTIVATRFMTNSLVLVLAGCASVREVQPIHAQMLLQTTTSWNGSVLPEYPTKQPQVTILRIKIQPGARLPWHEHPIINAGVLLRGKLTIHSDDQKTLHLVAGDAFAEEVNQWHYGNNEGTETAEVVVFYAGTPGQPLSIPRDSKDR